MALIGTTHETAESVMKLATLWGCIQIVQNLKRVQKYIANMGMSTWHDFILVHRPILVRLYMKICCET